jgi:methylmalonyl-CoA/ethylmalonyl-CoA epimerase
MSTVAVADIAAIPDLLPHHVSIAVPDMEQAISWYAAILGFEVELRFHVAGIPADGAFLRRPELRIELWCAHGVQPVPAERRVPDADLRTAGTKHMAFAVPNLQGRLPELVRRGVDIAALQRSPTEPMRPEADPLAAGKPPVFALFMRDPAGTLIELLDRDRLPA